MNKFTNLNNWILNPQYPFEKRIASISIRVTSINLETLKKTPVKDRIKKINDLNLSQIENIIQSISISKYTQIIENDIIVGIKTKVPFDSLNTLKRNPNIPQEGITIHKLQGAKIFISKSAYNFYCIKLKLGLYSEAHSEPSVFEEKYILIKAKSFEDAFKRIKKNATLYEYQYLNSDKIVVNWKIISFEDCYITNIQNINDFNINKGNQVFSKITKSKLTENK